MSRAAKILALALQSGQQSGLSSCAAESLELSLDTKVAENPVSSYVSSDHLSKDEDKILESTDSNVSSNHLNDDENPELFEDYPSENNDLSKDEDKTVEPSHSCYINSKHLDDEEDPELFEDSGSSFVPSDSSDSDEGEVKQKKNKKTKPNSSNKEMIEVNHDQCKRKRALKGQGNPQTWKRNSNQLKRMRGENYQSQKTQNNIRARHLTLPCNAEKCKLSKEKRQCFTILEENRIEVFNYFWKELDWNSRKVYVSSLVQTSNVKQQTVKNKQSRRNCTLHYNLKISGKLVPVCKKMFLSTLGVKEWSVRNWAISSTARGSISKNATEGGGKEDKLKIKRQNVTKFLNELPKMPSHYCRSSSTKLYLEPIYQSYADVYKVYKEYCSQNEISDVSGRWVFTQELQKMNIGLFQPKKDQCDLCFAHNLGNNVSESDYQTHIHAKDRAREEKCIDKEKALAGEVCVFTADVQAIQLVPFTKAGGLYFKQKLACKNYTIYNVATRHVVCYVWHEGEGGAEANNFASCLLDFLEHELTDEEKSRKCCIFYTDGCAAQNRNVLLSNALQYYSISQNTTIIQKFLIKGHTQMECDSVHSTIERRKKNREIFSPANYVQLIEESRHSAPGPYRVKYIHHDFFKDYTALNYYNSIRPGRKPGDNCVNDLRALKYGPQLGIEYKISFNDDWQLLPQRIAQQDKTDAIDIPKLYSAPLPITTQKYEHLQFLKGGIHKDYHGFYDSLVHN